MTKKDKNIVPDEIIMNQIYFIRNNKVMIDKDLATLYGVETKYLKRQVKRNIERFPPDFMFELNESEFTNLRSQFGTSSWGGSRYAPMVFTEHGVLMLSSVLNSEKSIAVNIQIMRIFTAIRSMLLDNTELRLEIEKIKHKLNNHDKNIELVFQYLDELTEKKEKVVPRNFIGFKISKKT